MALRQDCQPLYVGIKAVQNAQLFLPDSLPVPGQFCFFRICPLYRFFLRVELLSRRCMANLRVSFYEYHP